MLDAVKLDHTDKALLRRLCNRWLRRRQVVVYMLSVQVVNVITQAVLLSLSLTSIADQRNDAASGFRQQVPAYRVGVLAIAGMYSALVRYNIRAESRQLAAPVKSAGGQDADAT